MRIRFVWMGMIVAAGAAGLVGLAACGDDDDAATSRPDASAPDNNAPDTGTPGTDSGNPSDAGSEGGTKTQQFTVPAGGGSFDFTGATMKLTFVFPASAAGKTITFAAATPADIGWPAGQFAEVIKLGPNGERFADPIVVRPEKKEAVSALLSFPDGAGKGPASRVPLNAAGDGFEVSHFSSLVVVSAGRLCDSEGYNDTPNAGACAAAGTRTTQRVTTCKGYSYCLNVSLTCCVDPAVDGGPGCTWDDTPFGGTYQPTDSNGGAYPYCEGDAGEWDGGASACNGANPKPFYNFNGAGCTMLRDCSTIYRMQCDGGSCDCSQQQGTTTVTGSFPQGATCDHTAAMRAAYVQKCNYPLAQ